MPDQAGRNSGGRTDGEYRGRIDRRGSVGRPGGVRAAERRRGELSEAHLRKLALIKEVAAELFYAYGYAATDLRTIADGVDMHVTTLYNYITEKEELLYMIMRDGMDEISASLEAALAEHPDDYLERLRAALRSHIMHHARRRHLARTGHIEVRSLSGNYLTEILDRRRDHEGKWLSLVKEGIALGVLENRDPQMTVYAMLAVGLGVSQWYDPDGRLSAEEIASSLAESALMGAAKRLDSNTRARTGARPGARRSAR